MLSRVRQDSIRNKKQKILIPGIGNAQIDALRYCKSHVYELQNFS